MSRKKRNRWNNLVIALTIAFSCLTPSCLHKAKENRSPCKDEEATQQAAARYEEAAPGFRRGWMSDSDRAKSHFKLGVSYRSQGMVKEARSAFRRAVQLKPDFVRAQYMVAETYAGEIQRGKAIAAYRKAVAIDPRYIKAHRGLAQTLRNNGDVEEALDSYAAVLALAPETDAPYLYDEIIDVLGTKQKVQVPKALIDSLEAAVAKRPTLVCLKTLIMALAHDSPQRDIEKAAGFLRRYVALAKAELYEKATSKQVPPFMARVTLVSFNRTGDPPWKRGNCIELMPVPATGMNKRRLPGSGLFVINMHAANFDMIMKRHNFKSIKVEQISHRYCLIVDQRIPPNWLREAPCRCVSEFVRVFCTRLAWIPPELEHLVPLTFAGHFHRSARRLQQR